MNSNGNQPPHHPNGSCNDNYNHYRGHDHYGRKKTSLKDAVIVFREKIWYFILTLGLVVGASYYYCDQETPIYSSIATLQILRDNGQITDSPQTNATDIRSSKTLNTQVKIIESLKLTKKVAARLTPEQKQALLSPYLNEHTSNNDSLVTQVLHDNKSVVPVRSSQIATVEFKHPNPETAALVANLFVDEYINYKLNLDIDNSMKVVDDLKNRVHQQRKKVDDVEAKMAAYTETHKTLSIDKLADMDHQELAEINTAVTRAHHEFDASKARVALIKKFEKEGKEFATLPFISEMDHVKHLQQAHSKQKINVSALQKRYGAKHPKMIEATRTEAETANEIQLAVSDAVEKVRNHYEQKKRNLKSALDRQAHKEESLVQLSKAGVEYNSLARDLEVNQRLYQSLVLRLNNELAQLDLAQPNARIIDRALPSTTPVSPQKNLIITAASVAGVFLGMFAVFIAAQFDDRTRSATDIEGELGLTLLGAIPQVKASNASKRAQAVASGSNRYVLEAFRSIHSTLRINNTSKDAKVLLCTSTQPGEGKTFFSVNLATTFAAHNESCVVIDTDLRVPTVAQLFNNENRSGVIQYCENNASLDSIIHHDPTTRVNYIPSGGISSNPTRILTSDTFSQLLTCLKQRYDHVLIDCPPLGAVSDMLNMLPHADGLLYLIKFNTTSRKSIKRNLTRISDTNTPIIGAVINQVSTAMADFYYSTDYNCKYMKKYIRDIKDSNDQQPPSVAA